MLYSHFMLHPQPPSGSRGAASAAGAAGAAGAAAAAGAAGAAAGPWPLILRWPMDDGKWPIEIDGLPIKHGDFPWLC